MKVSSLVACVVMSGMTAFADSSETSAVYKFDWYAGDAVANFPAPMTLREGLNGFTYEGFAEGGSDLRVKDADGNLLPHEIEKWDPNGYSIVWVKLPSLSQSATVTLSWGDAEAESSEDSLWDDAFHVFHFGDSIAKDSSKWKLTVANTPDAAAGIIGGGMTCSDTSTKRLVMSNVNPSQMGVNSSSSYTLSFWLKGKESSYSKYLYNMKTTGNEVILTYNYNNKWAVALRTVELIGGGTGRANSRIQAPDYDWHHFAYVYDSATQKQMKYLDGVLVDTQSRTESVRLWAADGETIALGGSIGGGDTSGATFDEFRLEPVARDAAWIKALALTPAQVHDNDDVYVMSFPEYTGTETLTDFPLMVTLDDRLPDLPDSVKSAMRNVNRLYFYTEDGKTGLPFEYELAPTESGTTMTCWVRMPTFGPGTKLRIQTTPTVWTSNASTTKRFWSSDAGAANTNVWADGVFRHVYHMALGRYRFDSVPGGADLKENNGWRNTSPAVDGPTGRYGAMHCSTNAGMIAALPNNSRGVTNRYTFSFWARKSAEDFANPQQAYLCQIRQSNNGSTQWGVLTGFHNDGNKFKLWKNGSSDGRRIDIPDTDWHYYAWTCDGTTVRGYRDGDEVMTGEKLSFNAEDMTNWRIAISGTMGAPNNECFRGDIDEFRIEGEPRSADWIKACYQTQFARRGRLTRLALPAFDANVAASSTTEGAITFAATLACRVPSTLTLYYGATDGGTDASAWTGSTPLGTLPDGRITGTVTGLSNDQGMFARFRSVNEFGEAWSQPIFGRAMAGAAWITGYKISVTNLAEGVTLKDFPLCVRVTASMEPPASHSTLRFVDDDGRPLAHEVESWDASGESIVWVRVPEMRKGTKVKMFWGDLYTPAAAAVSSVWNEDYESVYHMSSKADSSAAGLDFTTDKTATNGVVGSARQMGASGGLMTAQHPMEGTAGPFTISGWLNGYSNMGETYLLLKCIGNTTTQMGVLFGYVPMTLQLYMPNPANPNNDGNYNQEIRFTHSLIELPDSNWHHFAYAYDGAKLGMYLDGECIRSAFINVTQCGLSPWLQIGDLRVGRSPGGGNLFKGGLDELRLETVGRSPEWIKACYDDQRGRLTSTRFVMVGMKIFFR